MINKKIIFLWILAIFAITLPYLYAYSKEGSGYVFKGFLLNPIDGYSYLAKMYQGWEGNWTFTLPFSIESGDRSLMFLYYIFLGHLARLFNCNLILIFHLARVLNFTILFFSITIYYSILFQNKQKIFETAVILSVLGSGLGWLILPFGYYAADFWVAEAYPFLSGYANPHFSLGISLMLWMLIIITQERITWVTACILIIISAILSLTLPFGVIVIGSTLFVLETINWIITRKIYAYPLLCIGLGSMPVLLYQYYQVINNPVLKIWNLQNITFTPPLWDIFLSFSPAIIFGGWGICIVIKENNYSKLKPIVAWAIVSLLLIYFPFQLQRRLMVGYYLPLAGLTAMALEKIGRPKLRMLVIAMSIISNIMLIISGIYSVNTHSHNLYLTKSEVIALEWIKGQTPIGSSVLASPDTGLVIPAITGRHVIYGHPFETPNAEHENENVIRWFNGDMGVERAISFIRERGIQFIFFGPREKELGNPDYLSKFHLVYYNQDVKIFSSEIE